MKKTLKTKVIINYIPSHLISLLKNQSSVHQSFISQLKLPSGFKNPTQFFVFRGILYNMIGYDPYQSFDYAGIKSLITGVLSDFYNFKIEGYVNQQNLESNKIFCIFRSFYPEYNKVFDSKEPIKLSQLTELEHFHNLVILVLLFDLELTIKTVSETIFFDKGLLLDLKQERVILQKNLSGGIRVSLSRNRLILINRLYIGFDTEYQCVDSQTNELLCYTTASMGECLLKIRCDSVDFSLKDGRVFLPRTASMITTGINLIRFLKNKKDEEVNDLKKRLIQDPSLCVMTLKNNDFVFRIKTFDFHKIKTSYIDLTKNPKNYSFVGLLNMVLDSHDLDNSHFTGLTRDLNPTIKHECTLISHFTTADVSLFHDFEGIKTQFSVLSKSFLTLDKFLTYKKWRVFLRDTSLLSPGGMSLKSIGQLYPDFNLQKIELTPGEYKNMKNLQEKHPEKFLEYAVQDAKIVLWHALEVQNSHYRFSKKYSIPVTLSSLASSYLENELVLEGNGEYHPKTLNGLISLRNIPKLMTPAGIELSGDLHEYIDYFLGSYHGGRNESFLYGIAKGVFYDYDLPGAYPTAMSLLDYPNWGARQQILSQLGCDLMNLLGESKILNSYTALKIKFSFPSTVKYPNLPVRLDFSSIIFPLSGETFCTGSEFIQAMHLNCQIQIIGGVHIPFLGKKELLDKKPEVKHRQKHKLVPEIDPKILDLFSEYNKMNSYSNVEETSNVNGNSNVSENYLILKNRLKDSKHQDKDKDRRKDFLAEDSKSQFFQVVQNVLKERIKYPKGSYMNLLYKFIANAGIGQMARGLNQKPRYDSHSNTTRVLPSGALISPLYAGWITSFIRSTLSELLNKYDSSIIVSCTTDGFITDKPNLDKLLPSHTDFFSSLYYETRAQLTGSGALLETKYTEPKGVISWRTRGQLGLSGGIKALSGYQRHEPIEQTIDTVNKSFKGSKQIAFIQTSLRSAKDIYQKGGHSTLILSERIFNLKFDNRREITIEKNNYHETKPFTDRGICIQSRLISSFGSGRYRMYSPISVSQCKGDAYLNLTRRMVVRLLRTDHAYLGVKHQDFSRMDICKILNEIGLKTSLNFISKQKDARIILNSIPSTSKTLECLGKLRVVFPLFDPGILIR